MKKKIMIRIAAVIIAALMLFGSFAVIITFLI